MIKGMFKVYAALLGGALGLFWLTIAATGQTPSSISGTWVIDPKAADGAMMGNHPPTSGENTHDEPRLTLDLTASAAVIRQDTGTRSIAQSFELSSSLALNLATREPRSATFSGATLTTRRVERVGLPHGEEVSVERTESYTLQTNGTLLLIRTTTTPRGSITRRHIFERSKSESMQ